MDKQRLAIPEFLVLAGYGEDENSDGDYLLHSETPAWLAKLTTEANCSSVRIVRFFDPVDDGDYSNILLSLEYAIDYLVGYLGDEANINIIPPS